MIKFQIFATAALADVKNANINALLGFPNGAIEYRTNIPHLSDDRVAVGVGVGLQVSCGSMTAEERLEYYDENNLVDVEYLAAEGWFSNESD